MKPITRLIYLLAIIKFILPFILVPAFYQPHRDEYLYLTEGHHLAWGFMEVPPMLSFLAWIINALGDGIFWIKFWPALLGSGTFLLTARIIVSLGGKSFAVILSFIPFVFTGYIRLFYYFHPNFLDVFFWTLQAYAIVCYLQSQQNRWLYLFGIAIGLGMMSKYSVAFYTVSLFTGLLISSQRKIFLNKHLYFSCLLALLIMLPNIIWQYNHLFPVVTHMAELQEEQLQFISPVSFLFNQLLIFIPCVFVWITGILFAGFTNEGKPYRLFMWAYISVVIILVALHGKDYYAMGAYPALFAFGAYYLEKLTALGWKKIWRYVCIAFSLILGSFIFPLLMPIAKPAALATYYKKIDAEKTGVLKWEDQKNHSLPQDFADMVEWKETAMKAGKLFQSLSPGDQKKTMVFARGYFFAAALNFHAKEAGLPEVYSDNASFLLWMPEKYAIKNIILISHHLPNASDRIARQFEKITVKDSITDPFFRESGIKISLLENGSDSVNSLLEKNTAKMKSQFQRKKE
jgi:hypothetical protein